MEEMSKTNGTDRERERERDICILPRFRQMLMIKGISPEEDKKQERNEKREMSL